MDYQIESICVLYSTIKSIDFKMPYLIRKYPFVSDITESIMWEKTFQTQNRYENGNTISERATYS